MNAKSRLILLFTVTAASLGCIVAGFGYSELFKSQYEQKIPYKQLGFTAGILSWVVNTSLIFNIKENK
jgi:hypothetical protein